MDTPEAEEIGKGSEEEEVDRFNACDTARAGSKWAQWMGRRRQESIIRVFNELDACFPKADWTNRKTQQGFFYHLEEISRAIAGIRDLTPTNPYWRTSYRELQIRFNMMMYGKPSEKRYDAVFTLLETDPQYLAAMRGMAKFFQTVPGVDLTGKDLENLATELTRAAQAGCKPFQRSEIGR